MRKYTDFQQYVLELVSLGLLKSEIDLTSTLDDKPPFQTKEGFNIGITQAEIFWAEMALYRMILDEIRRDKERS